MNVSDVIAIDHHRRQREARGSCEVEGIQLTPRRIGGMRGTFVPSVKVARTTSN
jgi:hypothetical protein